MESFSVLLLFLLTLRFKPPKFIRMEAEVPHKCLAEDLISDDR